MDLVPVKTHGKRRPASDEVNTHRRSGVVPQFVRSYLEMRHPASHVGMKKGDYLPDVMRPTRTGLPQAGAAVPPSNLEFMRRNRRSKHTYIVSAALVGMSPKRKGCKNKSRRQPSSAPASVASGPPPWETLRDFANWQNNMLKDELIKHQFNPLAELEEREIPSATVLQIRGRHVEEPESTIEFEKQQRLAESLKDFEKVAQARRRIKGANRRMQGASMDVLKAIAHDRIDKYGCQEPDLVTDKELVKSLRVKPPPRKPREIVYTHPHMDILRKKREEVSAAFDHLELSFGTEDEEENEDVFSADHFTTQVSRSRTFLTEN